MLWGLRVPRGFVPTLTRRAPLAFIGPIALQPPRQALARPRKDLEQVLRFSAQALDSATIIGLGAEQPLQKWRK